MDETGGYLGDIFLMFSMWLVSSSQPVGWVIMGMKY